MTYEQLTLKQRKNLIKEHNQLFKYLVKKIKTPQGLYKLARYVDINIALESESNM